MASVSRTPFVDRICQAATFATRATVAVGIPAYLFFQLDSLPTLKSPQSKLIAASVAIISTPSTLYCAMGAIEGFVRSCGHYFNYLSKENSALHWDKFSKEMTTIHGLVRGGLSPLSGYAIMYREWNKLGLNKDEDSPRVLKEEYFVYSIPRAFGRGLVEVCKWGLRKLKLGLDRVVETGTIGAQKIWAGVCWVANTTISIVRWGWKASQPGRQWLWDTAVAVATWTVDRIVDLWNITQPIRRFVKLVVWDYIITKVIIDGILTQLIWNFVLKKVIVEWLVEKFIWNFLIQTIICKVIWPPVKFISVKIVWNFVIKKVIAEWLVEKFIWNFLIQTVIWPPIKFIWTKILWPTIKWIANVIATIVSWAFEAISWATKKALGRG